MTFGSYELRDLDHLTRGQLFEGKLTIDKTYGHAAYGCMPDCCLDDPTVDPGDYYAPVNTSNQDHAWSNCPADGMQYDLTPYTSTWTTTNSSVATIGPYSGYVNLVGAGSSNLRAYVSIHSPYSIGAQCRFATRSGGGTGNGQPTVTSINPVRGLVGATVQVTISGTGLNVSPSLVFSGSGITASNISATSSQLTADLSIALAVTGGNQSVKVNSGGQLSNSVNFFVQVPHHLKVVSDSTGPFSNCPSTVRRLIEYQEVDVNNNPVGTISTKEQFGSKSANSCGTTINTNETCSPDANGTLIDDLKVGCNSVGGSCGFTYTDQKWLWCPGGNFSPVVIASPGTLIVHNDSISVGGNTSGFAAGTMIYP